MDSEDTEFDFDAEASDSGTLADAAKKIKKLKVELEACKAERQEYLDGWQRLRADIANQKRDDQTVFANARSRAREDMVEELLPILDAFDMAMQSPQWGSVDSAWRSGIEYIHTQFNQVLGNHGITAFGAPGDTFDPHLHEATADSAEGITVLKVIRRGYCINDKILRPAQVVVGN